MWRFVAFLTIHRSTCRTEAGRPPGRFAYHGVTTLFLLASLAMGLSGAIHRPVQTYSIVRQV